MIKFGVTVESLEKISQFLYEMTSLTSVFARE